MMHPSTYEYLKPTDEQIERMARVRALRPFAPPQESLSQIYRMAEAALCGGLLSRLPNPSRSD